MSNLAQIQYDDPRFEREIRHISRYENRDEYPVERLMAMRMGGKWKESLKPRQDMLCQRAVAMKPCPRESVAFPPWSQSFLWRFMSRLEDAGILVER